MRKIVIFSTDVYTDLSNNQREEFRNILQDMINRGNKVIFTAREQIKKSLLNDIDINGKEIYFLSRDNVKSIIKDNQGKENYFIVVGNKDADLYMAATNKLFYIVPRWCNVIQERAERYGIEVKNIEAMSKLIDIIENQNSWFYRLDLDEQTTILSLTSANTKGIHSSEEIEMIKHFRAYLKDGKKKYAYVLLCHFLAAISNKSEFRGIQDWSIMPSSGIELNEDMLLFKEKARKLMNGRKEENIFLRHTPTWKSHDAWRNGQNRKPCDRHFETIILNDYYKGKLKNRTVCVFDDYSTYGTTFETARNLLKKEGVKKMFFVSLGKFGKEYLQQEYSFKGSLYKQDYTYNLNSEFYRSGEFDTGAIKEIENLHDIIFK